MRPKRWQSSSPSRFLSSAMVAPLPDVPTPPVMVQVCAVAVKVAAVTFAPLTVTATLAGLKV